MTLDVPHSGLRSIPTLLRGEAGPVREWMVRGQEGRLVLCVGVIIVGAGCFGAATGIWRAPLQAVYTAIKFPLILLLTALGNGLLNALLAPLLGVNLTLRQSLLAVLMSFTIAASILGAFSPLLFFAVWNTPPLGTPGASAFSAYSFILLTQTAAIAFAGIAANIRLVQLLRELSGSAFAARKVLFAWLVGNLFLGSQLAWIFRPFVGSPGIPLQFLRSDAMRGSFYEGLWNAARHLLAS
jgi:hypothetical protein